MAAITDKGMQAKASASDTWLTQPFMRGAGVFVGRITPSGERLFYFRYTDSKGKRPFLPIGPYHPKGVDGLTLAQAYDKAAGLSDLYRSGVRDLREHFAQQAEAQRTAEALALQQASDQVAADALARERRITVRQLFERWASVELKPHTRADGRRTGRKDGGDYTRLQLERRIFPTLGNVAAAEVRKADLLAILDSVKADGKLRTANVLLADLKQMFRFALVREVVERNPLDTVTKRDVGGTEVERERVLSADEIKALHAALPAARVGPRTEAAIWLILATGARVGEAMGARWEHVNASAMTWHLPETKNERDHTIHLSAFALAQFAKLAALREVLQGSTSDELTQWVFPAKDSREAVCVKSFGKQLADRQRTADRRMARRSKRTDSLTLAGGRWTAHDLRRTAGTLMAGLGISGDVIDECLNHIIESRVRRTYVRDRRPTEQARAFDALGAKLQEIVSGEKAASNVIGLHLAA